MDWLTDADFKNWLTDTDDNSATCCKICHKTFKLSNMGRQALISHASGKSNSSLNRKKVSNKKHAGAVVRIILKFK